MMSFRFSARRRLSCPPLRFRCVCRFLPLRGPDRGARTAARAGTVPVVPVGRRGRGYVLDDRRGVGCVLAPHHRAGHVLDPGAHDDLPVRGAGGDRWGCTWWRSAPWRRNAEMRAASVKVLGLRAPLGVFLAAWGGVAMLTSAPFDNWWHNAYGLDVKIVSPAAYAADPGNPRGGDGDGVPDPGGR